MERRVEWSGVMQGRTGQGSGGEGKVEWSRGMVWYGKWEDMGGENIVEWSRAG